MNAFGPDEIRNLAVVGHGGCGKTSIVSSLLHSSGTINRFGRVEDGSTITDFDPDEIERQTSMQLAACHLEWKKNKVNLIDAPGDSAFLFDAQLALQVVETALIAVCAVSGVEVGTGKTWKWAEDRGLSRFLVVSRLDRERADFQRTMLQIQERLGREAMALQLPIGSEHDFQGVVDLVTRKAYSYETDLSGKFKTGEVPADMADQVEEARQSLVEMVAEMDDALMEKYLEEGEIGDEEFLSGLRNAIRNRQIFPVFAVAAGRNMGTHPLLDALVDLAPSPADAGSVRGTKPGSEEEVERAPDLQAPYSAYVFKTLADPFAGRITMFRVYSGEIASDHPHHNATRDAEERFGPTFLFQGKDHHAVARIGAGDIGGVAKLKETLTNDTLADKGNPVLYPTITPPPPAIAYALEPKTKGDEDKLGTALTRLREEDLSLKVERDPQTHQLLVSGNGEMHILFVVKKLHKRFHVEVELKAPKVPYLETITRTASARYRHKKQTGGAGQFAEVHLRVEPRERGSGFEYASEVFGGAISHNFIPSIEKGIKQVIPKGVIAGYPVIDFKAVVYDGKEHPVDSKDVAFQTAGREAFKLAVKEARPTILEPIMQVEITCPEENMGDIMGDLNQRRGRVQGMDSGGAGDQVIRAQVPMAEMLTYAPTLKSITGGRGEFRMELDHYADVPANIKQQLIEAAEKARQEAQDS